MKVEQAPRNIFGAKRTAPPPREPITEVLRRVDAQMIAEVAQANEGETMEQEPEADAGAERPEPEQRPDPAPSAPAMAEERARQLVTNISTAMIGELRGLRDQIDDLIRDMNARRDLIIEAVRAHGEFADAAIQQKRIIGEFVARLRAEFDKSQTPLPPARTV